MIVIDSNISLDSGLCCDLAIGYSNGLCLMLGIFNLSGTSLFFFLCTCKYFTPDLCSLALIIFDNGSNRYKTSGVEFFFFSLNSGLGNMLNPKSATLSS